MPVRLISSVRGMGVAVIVSTSTLVRSFLMASLCCTPKRCSSSMTSRPRSLNSTPSTEQPVGADDAVDLARRQAVDHRLGLGRGEEAGEHLDAHRVVGEAVAEGLAVLLREERGGHQHGDLLAVLDGLERGADRHLGLAEPDVAAQRGGPSGARTPCRPSPRRWPSSWSGVSTNGKASSISFCHGVSGAKAKPAACTRRLVQDDELLGDLPHRGRAPGSWPARSRRRRGGGASATRRRRSGGRRRSGRTGRRACRRPCTRAAGSRARRRRSSRLTMPP